MCDQRHPSHNSHIAHRKSQIASVSGGRVAAAEALARFLDVTVEHEQPIGVPLRVGEVELFTARQLQPQVLLEVIDLEGIEGEQRRRELIVLVRGLVSDTLRRGHEPPAARADAMSMNHVYSRVET